MTFLQIKKLLEEFLSINRNGTVSEFSYFCQKRISRVGG